MVENLIMKSNLESFLTNGICHNFSAPCTPQSNGVVERKNRTLTQNPNYDLEEVTPRVDKIREVRDHFIDQVIGELDERTLRSHVQDRSNFFAFVSTIEPKNTKEAIKDESWTMAMQEELDQFEKARLASQGYNRQEGIDYDETYALVVRLETIRILLAYACSYMFKKFQMDVKSAFLNGVIDEEVYVAQPSGFVDFQKPNHVYKLKKAVYGLKQALTAWKRVLTLEKDNKSIDSTKYKGMIGSLLYLTASRPDIMFSVCLCARFQEDKDKVKEPLSPKLNEDKYSICCENTTRMMNALKEVRIESREMLLSIHHSLKMLLDILSKMNRKLDYEKVKRNDKGKEKVNDF
ncbi:retrovirus-related pol polyprotein from transposon TNT 1-94 [Tanacetum coccineum]